MEVGWLQQLQKFEDRRVDQDVLAKKLENGVRLKGGRAAYAAVAE